MKRFGRRAPSPLTVADRIEVAKGSWRELLGFPQRKEQSVRRTIFSHTVCKIGAGGAVGAGLMYLFDPSVGRRRRAYTRDRATATVRHGWRRAERLSARTGAGVYGLSRKAIYAWRPAEPVANDQMLTDRVLSQIFRDRGTPHGRININVQDGVVVLRGELDQPDQIRDLEERVRRVAGVQGVENYLHLPHTPAPNKQDVLQAD